VAAHQSAFGLNLLGVLDLPGLPGPATGLPELELQVVEDAELEGAWSGAATPGSWRGTLRDGAELTIRWGHDGDLRFGYGDNCRYLLDADAERLLCAPVDRGSLAWQRVLLSRVLPVVAIARGYEALHAAAVQTPAGAVAIVGVSGAGKSTLAAELVRRGHPLVGDDVLVVGRDEEGVLVFPGGAYLSLEPGAETAVGVEVLGEFGGKFWAVAAESASEPAPVAAVVLLERGEGPVEVQELSASPLTLAPFMLGLPDEVGRDGDRFALYADLVEAGRLLRLGGAVEAPVAEFADVLEAALGTLAPAAAGVDR
jgi:HPr Serine kinase C-terminal domain